MISEQAIHELYIDFRAIEDVSFSGHEVALIPVGSLRFVVLHKRKPPGMGRPSLGRLDW